MNPGAKCVNWCAVPPATGCSQDYPPPAIGPARKVTLPLKTQFNDMREFALEDRDGWVLTIAEKVR